MKHAVAVETDANPHRLDLDWRWHHRALDLGCIFSINPDAHSIDELDLTSWGVLMARKGGIPPNRVLNCMDHDKLESYLSKRASGLRGPDLWNVLARSPLLALAALMMREPRRSPAFPCIYRFQASQCSS